MTILLVIALLTFSIAGTAGSTPDQPPDPYVPETGPFTQEQLINYARTYGTPLYVYDGNLIQQKLKRFRGAFEAQYPSVKVFYALKANTNMAIVSLLRNAGAECISLGEMQIAVRLGFRGEDMLFTSSAKTPEELRFAIEHGVTINLDSFGDLENLRKECESRGKRARISFRVNPDVDPHTHRFIATGHRFSKFGILLENDEIIRAYEVARACRWFEICGIQSHIGSQITELEPFERNARLLAEVVRKLRERLGIELRFVNLGGGLGIPYHDGQEVLTPERLAEGVCRVLKEELKGLPRLPALWLEPGRYLVGDSGVLLATVISVKDTPYRDFINVNTGFNHLVRPLLYDAYHRVRVLGRSADLKLYDVAGNICETGDILACDRLLPTPASGDIVAFLDAGAYGFSMASSYNSFDLPAEILVRGDKVDLIRRRGDLEELLRSQSLPEDLRR
ncbi:MAG: diaminopimelate decarboxylase [Acidobacteriota bacterium]